MSNGMETPQPVPAAPPVQPPQAQPSRRPRGLMGPVVLITIGTIFLIGQMTHGWGFKELWPVILIVIGLVKIYESMSSGTSSGAGAGG